MLVLDNCDIGCVEVGEFASLTIEVKEGTTNYITGARGRDGIYVNGNLTITGAGNLNVYGSDNYSVREGDFGSVGYGMSVYGTLTLENHVQVMVKAGESSAKVMIEIIIDSGNLHVNKSKLEVHAIPQREESVG